MSQTIPNDPGFNAIGFFRTFCDLILSLDRADQSVRRAYAVPDDYVQKPDKYNAAIRLATYGHAPVVESVSVLSSHQDDLVRLGRALLTSLKNRGVRVEELNVTPDQLTFHQLVDISFVRRLRAILERPEVLAKRQEIDQEIQTIDQSSYGRIKESSSLSTLEAQRLFRARVSFTQQGSSKPREVREVPLTHHHLVFPLESIEGLKEVTYEQSLQTHAAAGELSSWFDQLLAKRRRTILSAIQRANVRKAPPLETTPLTETGQAAQAMASQEGPAAEAMASQEGARALLGESMSPTSPDLEDFYQHIPLQFEGDKDRGVSEALLEYSLRNAPLYTGDAVVIDPMGTFGAHSFPEIILEASALTVGAFPKEYEALVDVEVEDEWGDLQTEKRAWWVTVLGPAFRQTFPITHIKVRDETYTSWDEVTDLLNVGLEDIRRNPILRRVVSELAQGNVVVIPRDMFDLLREKHFRHVFFYGDPKPGSLIGLYRRLKVGALDYDSNADVGVGSGDEPNYHDLALQAENSDYIHDVLVRNIRFGNQSADIALRGTWRTVPLGVPGSLLEFQHGGYKLEAEALRRAAENLARHGSYVAQGPGGQLFRVVGVTEEGQLQIEPLTLDEYLQKVVGEYKLDLHLPDVVLRGYSDETLQFLTEGPESPAPTSTWEGADRMLVDLGLSEPDREEEFAVSASKWMALQAERQRRFVTIFGWGSIRSPVVEETGELRDLQELFDPNDEWARLTLLATAQLMGGEQRGTLERAADRIGPMNDFEELLTNPAKRSVAQGLLQLIKGDERSRVAVALKRTYLGSAGVKPTDLEMAEELGQAAFSFAAEFIKRTPPGSRIPGLRVTMPQDPEEMAEFLHRHLLHLMVYHALRRTSLEEHEVETRTESLQSSEEDRRPLEETAVTPIAGQAPQTPEQIVVDGGDKSSGESPSVPWEVYKRWRNLAKDRSLLAPDEVADPIGYLSYISEVLTDVYEERMPIEAARLLFKDKLIAAQGVPYPTMQVSLDLDVEKSGSRFPLDVVVLPYNRVRIGESVLSLRSEDPRQTPASRISPIPIHLLKRIDFTLKMRESVEASQEQAAQAILDAASQASKRVRKIEFEYSAIPLEVGVIRDPSGQSLARPVLRFPRELHSPPGKVVALDIETDVETGRVLQIGIQPSDEAPPVLVLIRSPQSEGGYLADQKGREQLRALVQRVWNQHGGKKEDVALALSEILQTTLRPTHIPDTAEELVTSLLTRWDVFLHEGEALIKAAKLLLGYKEAGYRLLVQNVGFDIGHLVSRLSSVTDHSNKTDDPAQLARSLQQQFPISEQIDVAELAVRVGHAEVNLEHLGHVLGKLAPGQSEAHLALEDAQLALGVYRSLLGKQPKEKPLEGQYLVGLGPGRLFDVSGPVPQQVIGLRDRVFRVVQAGYDKEQQRVSMELEEIHFGKGGRPHVQRRLRFEPVLNPTGDVQPLWQASLEMSRMFVVADKEQAKQTYALSMEDALRREIERIISPDLPPQLTARMGQRPSIYGREGLLDSIMTILRAHAVVRGGPPLGSPEEADLWVRRNLGLDEDAIDPALSYELAQRVAFYLTTPYASDPRRVEVFHRLVSWLTERRRMKSIGEALSDLLRRGREENLSWSDLTVMWRSLMESQLEEQQLEKVPIERPFYRSQERELSLFNPRGGFHTISIPEGLSPTTIEAHLLHRVRTQLRHVALETTIISRQEAHELAIRAGLTEDSPEYQSLVDALRLSVPREILTLAVAPQESRQDLLKILAGRRMQAQRLLELAQRLDEVEGDAARKQVQTAYQATIQALQSYHEQLTGMIGNWSSKRQELLQSLQSSSLPADVFVKNQELSDAVNQYVLRVALPIDTVVSDLLQADMLLPPPPAGDQENREDPWSLPDMSGSWQDVIQRVWRTKPPQATERLPVEQLIIAPNLRQALQEGWDVLKQQARMSSLAGAGMETDTSLDEIAHQPRRRSRARSTTVGAEQTPYMPPIRLHKLDTTLGLPIHSAVSALHEVMSTAAEAGVPVTLSDISSRVGELLGVSRLQIGDRITVDWTKPTASLEFLRYLTNARGVARSYVEEINRDWLRWAYGQLYRLYYSGEGRPWLERALGPEGAQVIEAPQTVPMYEEYEQSVVRPLWRQVSERAFSGFTPFPVSETVVSPGASEPQPAPDTELGVSVPVEPSAPQEVETPPQAPVESEAPSVEPEAPSPVGAPSATGTPPSGWGARLASGPWLSLGLVFGDDIVLLGMAGLAALHQYLKRRKRKEDDEAEGSGRRVHRTRRGTDIAGRLHFAVRADPTHATPAGHLRFHSDQRHPRSHRLRRMERDMEGLL